MLTEKVSKHNKIQGALYMNDPYGYRRVLG